MNPEKAIRVASHGMAVLSKRIRVLRDELEPLLMGHCRLHGLKHFALLEVIEVQHIPEGMTAAKQKQDVKKAMDSLTDAQAADILAALEQRLNK